MAPRRWGLLLAAGCISRRAVATRAASVRHRTARLACSSATDPRACIPHRSYADALKPAGRGPFALLPIAYVSSPYKERFGTPRQATVDTQVLGGAAQEAEIVLDPSIAPESLRGLDGFDYCWVYSALLPYAKPLPNPLRLQLRARPRPVFVHRLRVVFNMQVLSWMHLNKGYRPLVTPPRLRPRTPKTPTQKVGLLATRAPHRPNPIALSALRILDVCEERGAIRVKGIDLIDGTPILDIKPYVPYCDAFPDAADGWIGQLQEPNGPDAIRYWPPPMHLLNGSTASVKDAAEMPPPGGDAASQPQ